MVRLVPRDAILDSLGVGWTLSVARRPVDHEQELRSRNGASHPGRQHLRFGIPPCIARAGAAAALGLAEEDDRQVRIEHGEDLLPTRLPPDEIVRPVAAPGNIVDHDARLGFLHDHAVEVKCAVIHRTDFQPMTALRSLQAEQSYVQRFAFSGRSHYPALLVEFDDEAGGSVLHGATIESRKRAATVDHGKVTACGVQEVPRIR